MSSTKGSPLLDLPAELRNRIYGFVFADCTATISCNEDDEEYIPRTIVSGETTCGLPGLLLANAQLRSETILIFYSNAHFITTSQRALIHWLKALGPQQRTTVQHVTLVSYNIFSVLDKDYLRAIYEGLCSRWELELSTADIEGDVPVVKLELRGLFDAKKRWPQDEPTDEGAH